MSTPMPVGAQLALGSCSVLAAFFYPLHEEPCFYVSNFLSSSLMVRVLCAGGSLQPGLHWSQWRCCLCNGLPPRLCGHGTAHVVPSHVCSQRCRERATQPDQRGDDGGKPADLSRAAGCTRCDSRRVVGWTDHRSSGAGLGSANISGRYSLRAARSAGGHDCACVKANEGGCGTVCAEHHELHRAGAWAQAAGLGCRGALRRRCVSGTLPLPHESVACRI